MNQNDEIEIDLLDLCKYILSKWLIILLGIIACGGLAFGFVTLKNDTVYSSKMKIYVSVPQTSDKVLIRDSADQLVLDYIELMKTDLLSERIARKTGLEKSKIKGSITTEQVEGTRYIDITVKTDAKDDTKKIAKALLPVLMDTISQDLKKDYTPTVVENASKIETEQTMNTKKYTVVGACGGFFVTVGAFFVIYLVQAGRKEKNNNCCG